MSEIGKRLKHVRLERGLTLQDIGKGVGLSRAGISSIETGSTKSPKPENLFKIADFLNVNPRWLCTGKGEVDPNYAYTNTYKGRPLTDIQENVIDDFLHLKFDNQMTVAKFIAVLEGDQSTMLQDKPGKYKSSS